LTTCVAGGAANANRFDAATKENDMQTTNGYFVDWNGDTRRVASPGPGLACNVVDRGSYTGVDVIDSAGFVCHEATYFATLADVEKAGVAVNLV